MSRLHRNGGYSEACNDTCYFIDVALYVALKTSSPADHFPSSLPVKISQPQVPQHLRIFLCILYAPVQIIRAETESCCPPLIPLKISYESSKQATLDQRLSAVVETAWVSFETSPTTALRAMPQQGSRLA